MSRHCFACGADATGKHVCPEPEVLQPQPPSKPFVKRWDPSGVWVHCIIERGKAWDPQKRAYTDVHPSEVAA